MRTLAQGNDLPGHPRILRRSAHLWLQGDVRCRPPLRDGRGIPWEGQVLRLLRTNIATIPDPPREFRVHPVVEGGIEHLLATIDERFVVIFADGLVSHFLAPEFAYNIRVVDDVPETEDNHRGIMHLSEPPQGGKKFAVDSSGEMVNKEDMRLELADGTLDCRTANCLGLLPADAKAMGGINSGVNLDQRRDLDEIYSLR